jgi:hypothetical protein
MVQTKLKRTEKTNSRATCAAQAGTEACHANGGVAEAIDNPKYASKLTTSIQIWEDKRRIHREKRKDQGKDELTFVCALGMNASPFRC